MGKNTHPPLTSMPHYGETHPDHPSLFWNGQYWDLKKALKKKEGLCHTTYCRNPVYYECRRIPGTGRTRMVTHVRCTKCKTRRWRVNNPLKWAYKNLRDHARQRKVGFTLTLAHFGEVCEASGYLLLRGAEGHHMHIDRIDACLGYEDGNIQVLTCSENVAKGNRERHYPAHIRAMVERKEEDPGEDDSRGVFSDTSWEDEPPVVDGVVCPF